MQETVPCVGPGVGAQKSLFERTRSRHSGGPRATICSIRSQMEGNAGTGQREQQRATHQTKRWTNRWLPPAGILGWRGQEVAQESCVACGQLCLSSVEMLARRMGFAIVLLSCLLSAAVSLRPSSWGLQLYLSLGTTTYPTTQAWVLPFDRTGNAPASPRGRKALVRAAPAFAVWTVSCPAFTPEPRIVIS